MDMVAKDTMTIDPLFFKLLDRPSRIYTLGHFVTPNKMSIFNEKVAWMEIWMPLTPIENGST